MSDENQGESPVVAYVLATGTLLVAACFMCLCLMCCAKCPEWRRRRRERRERNRLLKNCTVVKYSHKHKQKTPSDTCAVCLEEFKEKELIIVCPCTHGYHKKCICDWLVHSPCCPLCKESVLQGLSSTLQQDISSAESTPLLL